MAAAAAVAGISWGAHQCPLLYTHTCLLPWLPSRLAKHALLQPTVVPDDVNTSSDGPRSMNGYYLIERRKEASRVQSVLRLVGQLAVEQLALLVMAIGILKPSTRETEILVRLCVRMREDSLPSYESEPLDPPRVHSAREAGGTP